LDEAQPQPHYNSDFDAAFSLSSCLGFASSYRAAKLAWSILWNQASIASNVAKSDRRQTPRAVQIPQLANSKAAASI
jgi:hypothetical protein